MFYNQHLLDINGSLCPRCVCVVVPDKVRFFTINRKSYDTIHLEWGKPLEPNGILIGYQLKYQLGELITHLQHFSTTMFCFEWIVIGLNNGSVRQPILELSCTVMGKQLTQNMVANVKGELTNASEVIPSKVRHKEVRDEFSITGFPPENMLSPVSGASN